MFSRYCAPKYINLHGQLCSNGEIMIIIPGSTSTNLALRVIKKGGFHRVSVERKVYADGESYIRFKVNVEGEDVAIIQSCEYPQDKSLIEILFMAATARRLGAEHITLVMPYFAYSREDKEFKPREAIGADIIIELIEAVGVNKFITFDIHNEETLKKFKIQAKNLTAMPTIGEYFRGKLKDPIVIAPDDGCPERAVNVAKPMSASYDFYIKKRDYTDGHVTSEEKQVPVAGRDVLIVDDIISTGGTIANCIASVQKQGARDIYVACTHPLLAGDALKKLKYAGAKEIVGTDAFSSSVSLISIAPIIVKELSKN
jgi:ribose-phosphate pyrophosphokinase